ncbi:unnamed protein product [Leuciscus chuanchicus]
MPLSETFVHSRAYLSLRKQPPSSGFVSLWSQTWPLCLQARRSACIPLTLTPKFQFCILPGTGGPQDHCFPRPYAGGKHVAISSARMEGTWHELFVADESPPRQLHRPLSFKEPCQAVLCREGSLATDGNKIRSVPLWAWDSIGLMVQAMT